MAHNNLHSPLAGMLSIVSPEFSAVMRSLTWSSNRVAIVLITCNRPFFWFICRNYPTTL